MKTGIKIVLAATLICLLPWSAFAQRGKCDWVMKYTEGSSKDDRPRIDKVASFWLESLERMDSEKDLSCLGEVLKLLPVNTPIGEWYAIGDLFSYGTEYMEAHTLLYSSILERADLPRGPFQPILNRIVPLLLTNFRADPNIGAYRTENDKPVELIDTPLGYAAGEGFYRLAEDLLHSGADPDYAWNRRRDSVIGNFSDGYKITYEDQEGWNALKKAVLSPKKEYTARDRSLMVKLLRRYGADMNITDNCGSTVLARLVRCAASDVPGFGMCPNGFKKSDYKLLIKALISAGADPKAVGKEVRTKTGKCTTRSGASALDIVKHEIESKEKRQEWKDVLKAK